MKRTQQKISIIGAGAVGSALAQRIIESDIADCVLIDDSVDLARATAYDLSDAAPLKGHERTITGTGNFAAMKSSNIVVITTGITPKTGIKHEELIAKNGAVVYGICEKVKVHAPQAIIIVATDPIDIMTYLACRTTGFARSRVLGMAGVLDGSRLIAIVADELKIPRSDIETFIMGSYGEAMVPVISKTTVKSESIADVIPKEKLSSIMQRVCDRGAEIVKLCGNGSASYAPSAGILKLIECIVDNSREVQCVSACLDGEYGMKDIALGVPCSIGTNGIEKIVEFELTDEEKDALGKSALAVKNAATFLSDLFLAAK